MKKQKSYFILLLLATVNTFLIHACTEKSKEQSIKKDDVIVKDETNIIKKDSVTIDKLTSEDVVVDYLKKNKKLPDYYITKDKAKAQGWVASKGNLCKVLPGKAIGGDVFSNRENKLPNQKGRVWYEADLNYSCGTRNADRVVFSNDGLIYITKDHYKTFQQK